MRAGHLVSKLIISHIRKDFPDKNIPNIPSYLWEDSLIQNGIHYRVLGIESLKENDAFPIIENENAIEVARYGFPPPENFAYAWNYERRYVDEENKSKLKILVIRDSFGAALIPFLKESFSESVFIFDAWQYGLNKPIIEKIKPDIVLFLTYESHLESIIE